MLLVLLGTTGCASMRGGQGAGAESPNGAINTFLEAANRKDINGMAAVWGTPTGGANLPKKELERRVIIMMQCLGHEKVTVGASSPAEGGRLRIPVTLTSQTKTASPVFTMARTAGSRWYVENFEIDQLRDQGFCVASGKLPR